MSMSERGALRGALGGAAVIFAVVTLPILLTSDAAFAPPTLILAAYACLPGAACGALAGALLTRGRSWIVAAAASSAMAILAVIAALLLFTDGQLTNDVPGSLGLAGALCGAATLVAVWQSWAMARRRDRAPLRGLLTRA
ncbi:hypothetical protein [uncultured Pseudokineococcus sp.]|uniref:hypothetical protein n=1 Tax=uncultured Pseudokineococcus sp. TaxID=1642928 RepID=UPI0026160A3A|nr:hypothetical protein [uncultured Pseudokineococcus sp.]